MFAGHIMTAGRWLREHTPGFLKMFKPKMNFITLHCTYTHNPPSNLS